MNWRPYQLTPEVRFSIIDRPMIVVLNVYPVPQNAPCISSEMNPVPKSPRENYALPVQNSWNGVNVPDSLQGERPKATGVSPWYGVYQNWEFL